MFEIENLPGISDVNAPALIENKERCLPGKNPKIGCNFISHKVYVSKYCKCIVSNMLCIFGVVVPEFKISY